MCQNIIKSILHSLHEEAITFKQPYEHMVIDHVLPLEVVEGLLNTNFTAPQLDGNSGTREMHNNKRVFYNLNHQKKHPPIAQTCEAFQSAEVVDAFEKKYDINLTNTFLRIEHTLDTKGFWLEPHTDIGAKVFTMLLYLSKDPDHIRLGTDFYLNAHTHAGSILFNSNRAMIFIPSDKTWHGFEKRPITGVRQAIIINYVKAEWRDRDQLSFPSVPVK